MYLVISCFITPFGIRATAHFANFCQSSKLLRFVIQIARIVQICWSILATGDSGLELDAGNLSILFSIFNHKRLKFPNSFRKKISDEIFRIYWSKIFLWLKVAESLLISAAWSLFDFERHQKIRGLICSVSFCLVGFRSVGLFVGQQFQPKNKKKVSQWKKFSKFEISDYN